MVAGSSDEPSSFVNIELYQTIVSHFQQKGLARLLVQDIDAFPKAPFARLSPHQKFPFPARVATGSVTGWSQPKDWVVVCAVRYEPVCGGNSLLTGKRTGNFAISGLPRPISLQETAAPQSLLGEFPTQINRENILKNREFFAGIREFSVAGVANHAAPPRRPQTDGDTCWRGAMDPGWIAPSSRPSSAPSAGATCWSPDATLPSAISPRQNRSMNSYLGRVLRLTLLSPTIIEAILEGRQPATLELADFLKQFPIEWDKQHRSLGF